MAELPIKQFPAFIQQAPATATSILVLSNYDDLETEASFHVVVKAESIDAKGVVTQGEILNTHVKMTGADYKSWDASKKMAVDFVVKKLGIELA